MDRGHKGLTGYLADFICGACTGAFISTLFYPVNVTKTHMQLVVGGPYQKCWTVFQDLYRTRGLRGMFAGVHVNYTRSFISWGIINTMYEVIHGKLVKLWWHTRTILRSQCSDICHVFEYLVSKIWNHDFVPCFCSTTNRWMQLTIYIARANWNFQSCLFSRSILQ